jgi:hypothetical protein
MSRKTEILSRAFAKEFRRPSELEQLKRFVRSLSAFQPDKTLPEELTDLLGRIDEAERLANSDRSRRRLPARRATS